jgi:dihydroneopterin aldolase
LRDELDEEAFRARMKEYTALLDSLAQEIVDRACQQCPQLDACEVRQLLSAAPASMALLFPEAA